MNAWTARQCGDVDLDALVLADPYEAVVFV